MAKREYIEANRKWLEEKAKEEGVQALPKGIYYKVLNAGEGKRCPAFTSEYCNGTLYRVDH
jgi:FKBP-type peptidyl-prolyl cis-trans isomerase